MKSYLEERIKYYDEEYRAGRAFITDTQFDQLERNLVPINKNKEPEFDTYGYYLKLLESFPPLERDVLKLRLGLGEPFEVLHTTDEIAEILNESKEIIEKTCQLD